MLLPVYNAAHTLPAALNSLLEQTYQNFEIVAVDDGSTDDSAATLAAYAERDPRVRVLRRPHEGVVAASQAGLLDCRGAFIARMDADDLCLPDRLARQRAVLLENPRVGVVSCKVARLADGDDRAGFEAYVQWLNRLMTPEDISNNIYVESPVANPSVMVRRADLLALGGYQERGWPEDYDLWLRYHQAGWQFAKVDAVLLHWRDAPTRLTRRDGRYSVENFIRARAHYLLRGPLADRQTLVVWGAGQMGRRLSKHLVRGGAPLVGFVDVNKAGETLLGVPVDDPETLPDRWPTLPQPLLLVAVGSNRARDIIRARLAGWGWREGATFICAA